MKPKVSICVPNLNMRPFLEERFASIFGQSFQDWELLVYDSYSDDGAWEYIRELSIHEKRMRVWQGPRQGTPASWTPCVREACGEYVYIATSDDSMAPDCLEKLVAALEEHSDCDLAHCILVPVDKDGAPLAQRPWPHTTVLAASIPELRHLQRHVRRAPYDGLLHLTGNLVYLSITQLLIRRSLFDRIGGFEAQWGSIGDVNWYMKAGLVANTVFVPDTWATWRAHPTLATASVNSRSAENAQRVEAMILDALLKCESYLAPEVAAGLRHRWLSLTSNMRSYYSGLRIRPNVLNRRLFQASQIHKKAVRSEIINRLRGNPTWDARFTAEMRSWLESLGLGPVVWCVP